MTNKQLKIYKPQNGVTNKSGWFRIFTFLYVFL